MAQTSRGTGETDQPSARQGSRAATPLSKAWIAIGLTPAFFVLASVAQVGLYALTGNEPGVGAEPLWVSLTSGILALVILLVPCIAGVVHGRRAVRSGVRAGWAPTLLAALLGVGAIVLVVLNL